MGNWLYDNTHKWVNHEFTPISATALRLRIISKVSGTAYGPALAEVEVYESGFSKSEDIKINTSGLVGMWRMDNDWEDSSVAGNHGESRNGATFSGTPKIGANSGSFDGTNDYIEVRNSAVLNPGAITIEAWAKSNAATWNNYGFLVSKRDAYILYPVSGSREIRFYIFADGAWQYVAYNDTSLDITQWHHYAGSFDGLNLNVYIDGVKQNKFYSGSMNPVDTGSLYFGWDDGQTGRYLNGLLDEVAVYNRALTDEEIQAHFRNYTITSPVVDPAPPSVTNVVSLSLSGTKPENTAVMVNGVQVAALDANTLWQGTYTLSPGMNTLSVTAMDGDGFHSKAVSLSVAYDNAAPVVTSTSPANNSFQNTPVNSVTFNIADAYSSLNLEAAASGAQVTKSGTIVVGGWSLSGAGASGTITFTPLSSLTEGVYEATIYPTDSFGHQSAATITFTVDSTPPAAPAFDQASVLTNNSSIIVTGTKGPDIAQVVLSGTGMSINTVTYPSSTTWSVTVSGLIEGTYTLTGYGLDEAGNQSSANAMTIVVDRTAPTKPAVSYPTLTKDATVSLSGTKPVNSYLYVNSQLTGNDFSSTAWSYAVSVSEGDNLFSVYVKDTAGNASEAVTATVTRDTAAPEIASSTPAGNSFVNNAATITISLSDTPAGVDLSGSTNGAEVKISNTAVSGSWNVSGSQLVFTPASGLSDGVYTVTLHPIDNLGNTGTVSFSFTLDTAAPVFQSLTMDPTSPHKAETVKFNVTFNEDMLTSAQPTATFTTGGLLAPTYSMTGSWTSSRIWQGTYTFTASTGDGTYILNISDAKDKAGNTMPAKQISDAFVLDTVQATPAIDAVTTPTNSANQALRGTKEAGTAIIINGTQRVAADSNTTWSCNYPLAEGTNTLTITARDSAGNDSPAISPAPVIVLDSKAPDFTVVYHTPWSSDTQILTGTKEAGCVVKLNGTQIFGPDDTNTTWSYTVSLTQGVTSHFAFTAADALGNTTSKTIDVLYDIAAPAALGPGVLTADGGGKGTEVTLSWTAYPETSDVAYYAVYKSSAAFSDVTGMTPIGTVNKGTNTYKATGLTLGSTYYFAVVPVDQAGNKTNSVNTVSAVLSDTAAPEDATNLSATAGYTTAQGNVITINWTASVNSNGDLAAQIIYVDSGTGYDAGTPLASADTTYAKSGLNDAAKYKFKLTVKDTAGHESQGVVVEASTRLNNPANLTATTASAQVSLSWTAATSSYLNQYNVYRKAAETQQTDVGTMTLVSSVKTTAYTDTGVTNDTTYQYAVTAVNTSGAERTDVQSVSATPRADSTGPVIDSFSITTNQVITAPITITASAHDAESDMDKVELYIDGVLVNSALRTPNSALVDLSYSWNVVSTTDGNHTVKVRALDSKGNATEDSRQAIVSLAPPVVPVITGHIVSQTTPTYTVTVSGTAPASTAVSLKVNGTVAVQAQTSDSGTFSFSAIQLPEGDNILNAKASHRGGESAYSSDYKITVDTGAPSAPKDLSAQVQSGGIIKFTWSNGTGETPTGYNLYTSTASFTNRTDTGVTKANTDSITYNLKDYSPADEQLRYYAVTALDGAGNESAISNVVSVSSDNTAPSVLSIVYTYTPTTGNAGGEGVTAAGPGTVSVALAISEAVTEAPFLSLEPTEGSPIVVSMKKNDDTHYTGSFTITQDAPHGATTYKFSGKDGAGNRGTSQGTGLSIDVKGPAASIESPLSVLQTTQTATEITLSFDEPSLATPSLTLKASNGGTALVTGMTTTDNGTRWTGSIDASLLADGQAEFLLSGAADRFGNAGSTVSSGRTILLYKDAIPAPGAPDGLTAKSGKGGLISLAWSPVAYAYSDSALTYNLYRRAEGETEATKIQTGIIGSTNVIAQDTPAQDGTYYYSVSAVGLLSSESQKSAEVPAVSDRVGPEAPTGLSLSLTGSGVSASWTAPLNEPSAMSYKLYRGSGTIADISGLTAVATSSSLTATDPDPAQSTRYYAVTALDALGNEGIVSETVSIDIPVAPVRNLVLERVETAAPVLTWDAPAEGSIIGYYLYRNGAKIIDTTVSDRAYTDGYYSGGAVTYGVSAVSSDNQESPVKEVTLPDLTISVKEGTTMRRGLLEAVPLVLANNSTASFSIDSLKVKAGDAGESLLQGPFELSANTTLQVEKVLATTATASSTVAVVATASWSPSSGVTVKITRSSSVQVTSASSALEIYSDPLVRGATVPVKLKVNNLGSGRMEFLSSENSGSTKKVKVSLKDQDGNVLATGYLNQQTGSVVNTGSYSVARINPNETFTTDPVTFTVPETAPYAVVIEASIENTYYHYGETDQVTAPGMTQTMETEITEAAYRATAATDKSFYVSGDSVTITGQALSNTTNQPMPSVSVKLVVSVKGYDRTYTVTTDKSGNYSYTFTPGASEAGTYSIWASHPDVTTRTIQATFIIGGIAIDPSSADWRVLKGGSENIALKVKNSGDAGLTNLQFTTETSTGITATISNSGDDILSANETQDLTLSVSAAADAPDTGFATLNVSALSSDGTALTAKMEVNLSMVSAIPVISTSPSYIDTGMVMGDQDIATITMTNTGGAALTNARIEGPSTSWITLTTDKQIGELQAGASTSIGVSLRPPDTLSQGVYDDQFTIYSDNHMAYTYHIQVTVTSNAVGSVLFDVLDELMQDVENASITYQHQTTTELIYTTQTGADGTATAYDLPEGRYSFNVSASEHKGFSGSFTISPGITITVPIALEVNLVEVEWSVVPVSIEDSYEIKVSQTFETNVPTPVIVAEPASITMPELQPGEVYNGEFKITNYGLVAGESLNIQFPSTYGEYDIELLSTLPDTLNAMQQVTVPYRITRRVTTAALQGTDLYALGSITEMPQTALLEEVMGFGGACFEGFTMSISVTTVICKGAINEMTVTKTADFSIYYQVACGSSSSRMEIGKSPSPPSGGYGYGSGGGQSGGTTISGGTPGPITSISTITCIYPKKWKCTECPTVCVNCGSSLSMGSGTYTFTDTDLKVPARSIPIEMSRTYRSNQIMYKLDTEEWIFASPMDSPLGWGWHSPWFATAKGDGSYIDGEGYHRLFKKDDNGNFLPDTEDGLTMTATATGYEVSKRGGNTSVFDGDGKLTEIKDSRGNTVTVQYDSAGKIQSVKDVMNRTVLNFAYDTASNHISSITDIAGRSVTYEYDEKGNLAKATLNATGSEPQVLGTYAYDLTEYAKPAPYCYEGAAEVIDCKGGICSTSYVDGYICVSQPVQAQEQQTGDQTQYAGSTDGTQTVTISPESSPPTNYHGIIQRTNAAGETWSIEYNDDWIDKGIVKRITGPNSNTFSATYDFNGSVFYNTDYSGRTFRRELNEDRKLIKYSEIDENGSEQVIEKIDYLDDRVEQTTDALGNVTKVQKDEWGNIIKKIDALGNVWVYTYDTNGRMLTSTDPLGTVTKYEYDEYGNKTKDIIAADTTDEAVTAYSYSQYGELATVTKDDSTTSYEYNEGGQISKVTDPLGTSTSMAYDSVGNLVTRTQPLIGDTVYSDYQLKGKPGKVTDVNSNATTYTYDSLGRVKTVTTLADNATTQYAYVTTCTTGMCGGANGQGKLDYVILPDGNKIDYDYDNAGNLITITDNDGNTINYSYDRRGNKIKEEIKDASGTLQKTVSYAYDLLNRPTSIVKPDSSTAETTYDANGNRASAKDPNGNITSYEYDSINRLVKTVQPGNTAISYTYDRRNNLTSVTDSNGNTTWYEFDTQNRVSKTVSSDTGTTVYTYDLNGNLKTNTNAENVTITYEYDVLNRNTKIDFSTDADTVYTYDTCVNGKGRVCTMTDTSGTTIYEYTPKGQVKKETKVIESVTYVTEYSYDTNGNLKTMKYPSGRLITYNYSNDQVVNVLSNAASLASNINYQPYGGMSSITYGNGIIGIISYDNQYQIRSIQAGTVLNLDYGSYDANGNITSITDVFDSTKNKTFTYDVLDRLSAANAAGIWGSLNWTYDGVGNRVTENGNVYSYAPNTNKLISANGISYGYDNNGNKTTEHSRQYIYNQNQRLIQLNDGATTANYVYNGNGQRVKKNVNGTTTIFHYSLKGQIIAESNSVGTITAEYVYLNGQPLAKIESLNTYYYHNDHLGTPQKMTDSFGAAVWIADYNPFGEASIIVSSTITNNLRFPGQYFDAESGLNYNYFRDYDPITGRYIEADPIGIKQGENHIFAYAANDSINNVDTMGLFCFSWTTKNNRLDVKPITYTRWKEVKKCKVTIFELSVVVQLLSLDVSTYSVKERTGKMKWDVITTTTTHTICVNTCPPSVTYSTTTNEAVTGHGSKTWKEQYWFLTNREWISGPDFMGAEVDLFSIGGSTVCIP
jgi:RHS repeat-associated protein